MLDVSHDETTLRIIESAKKDFLQNGCAELEITEPLDGFMISEFRFVKKR